MGTGVASKSRRRSRWSRRSRRVVLPVACCDRVERGSDTERLATAKASNPEFVMNR